MKNLSISARLALGFTLITLIFAAVAVFIEIQANQVSAIARLLSERTQPKVEVIADLNDAVQRVRVYTRSAIIETEEQKMAKVREQLDHHLGNLSASTERLAHLIALPGAAPEEEKLFADVRERLAQFSSITKQIGELAFANRNQEANELLNAKHGPAAMALNETTTVLKNRIRSDSSTALKALNDDADGLTIAVIVAAAMFIVASVLISVMITRSIAGQIGSTLQVVKRIAAGDLTQDIQPEGRSEIALLQAEVQAMQRYLRTMVHTIGQATSELGQAASQLSQATQQVRSSSDSQAGLASSMAASLEELSTSINHVSELSGEARQVSERAGQSASAGADDIGQMVDQIRDVTSGIEQSAERAQALGQEVSRITSIVHVIRDVADQTNLLALNAAIEAARAGEMGRGFAVVADEVRKLAEQSARSASEITDMVGRIQKGAIEVSEQMQGTVERVRGGLASAENGRERVLDIDRSSQQVVGTISEVSGGLQEQATASQELARRVEQIVQIVEENASSAGAVADSASQLAGLSSRLQDEVSRFRV
ncbi:methyl-accepting chemotaxis protein [Methyloversatilis thermotolerans]|uniref:methyl-accepting chemotaxis protein n=1 Tax=Methyloversatilis thermotolerans TaxID=1346290 RepID=UPI0003759B32|nr:methyl-accepting chemotaxis protein [Methyloversatilis thermotolerans]